MVKISVVIPTYNRPDGLERVLTSLVQQTMRDFELIVVEDGSKVGEKVVNHFKGKLPVVKYYWQANAGPATARNRGIKESSSQLIAFTDDDMQLPPDWLEQILAGFNKHPEVVGVGGYMKAPPAVFQRSIFAQYEWFVSHDIYQANQKSSIGGFENPAGGTNNIAFKKVVLEEVGLFDPNFPVPAGEDADLKKRITDRGYQLLYIPLQALHYQPYGLKRFIKQSYLRGIGTFYFVNKHESKISSPVIYRRFLVLPLNFLVDLLSKKTRKFAVIRLIESFMIARGLLTASKGKVGNKK